MTYLNDAMSVQIDTQDVPRIIKFTPQKPWFYCCKRNQLLNQELEQQTNTNSHFFSSPHKQHTLIKKIAVHNTMLNRLISIFLRAENFTKELNTLRQVAFSKKILYKKAIFTIKINNKK